MKPLFVRELSDPERHALQAGLRSADGFTVRRCHILLASARGDTAPMIAQAVGCTPQAVRNVLRAFETRGLAGVALQSRRPHTAAKLFDAERSQRLKALLHQSPRQFGKARSTWTLALAAEVCAEHGITAERVSYDTGSGRRTRLGFLCGREAGRLVRPEARRRAMARVADHLSVEDLEARLRSAQDPTATRHFQVIWLLARGHTIADVAAVTSFVPRWIEQLLARYNAHGPEALGDLRRRNGSAPSVLRPELLARAPPPPSGRGHAG